MKILVAPDSFKESLDAFSVAEAISAGLHRGLSGPLEVVQRPLADGGEGLLQVLLHAQQGTMSTHTVTGPMGLPVKASIGFLDDGSTAVLEMASAAGLPLVPQSGRDPVKATTRGVGELMRHALDSGARRIIIGLGGSATNDGGAGMAQALGVSLRDSTGNELVPGGGALETLHSIDLSGLDARIREVEVIGACDVTNRLCGPEGASQVYGPQKGASPEAVVRLDTALQHFGQVILEQTGRDILDLPGGGAAGGLGAGLAAFTGAQLRPGIDLVFEAYGDMEALARTADMIISGEGSVDGQTLHGKVIAGVAALAKRHGKPLVVLAGRIKETTAPLYAAGVTAVFPITPAPMDSTQAMAHTSEYLEQSASNLGRLAEHWCGKTVDV